MLESALTILLFVVIALLLRYLLRDYENGVVHTQIGSFRRDENKLDEQAHNCFERSDDGYWVSQTDG